MLIDAEKLTSVDLLNAALYFPKILMRLIIAFILETLLIVHY
jgi:hypothetical protein